MKNIGDKADSYQEEHDIDTEDLIPPISTFALALVDKNGNEVLDGSNLLQTFTRILAAAGGDGLSPLRVARATFDPSAKAGQRAIAAHGLGVTIPTKAIVVGGFIQVKTTFTSATDAGTIAISLEAANDIRSAVAISSGTSWDEGKQAIIPKSNTPESTSVSTTAAREITATVAVEALTAGKAIVFLFYVMGE